MSSLGLVNGSLEKAGVVVLPANTPASTANWADRVDHGIILILEGDSPTAAARRSR